MKPAARVQSAIEILDAVIAAANGQGAPADRLLSEWFRAHRFAGSSDKRAIREHVYAAIRACGPVPASGRAAMLRVADGNADMLALFDGSAHAPAPVGAGELAAEGGLAPAWLEQRLAKVLRQAALADDVAARQKPVQRGFALWRQLLQWRQQVQAGANPNAALFMEHLLGQYLDVLRRLS